MKILLIEDNEMIIKALKYLLESHEYYVDVATSIKEAKEKITNTYDLIILDVMLPDGNGLDFFKEYVSTPALVLSAKDEEKDVVKAIDLGVQDYIIKPFRSMELLSRINNIIKRNKKNTIKEFENIKFDMDAYKIYVDNLEVVLTGLELKILFLMLENSGCLVTREMIIDKIWDASGKFVNDNTLSVYIKRIREKLKNDDLIKTIKGIGYRIDL
jgi:DNA-binding response OmpR family regulator